MQCLFYVLGESVAAAASSPRVSPPGRHSFGCPLMTHDNRMVLAYIAPCDGRAQGLPLVHDALLRGPRGRARVALASNGGLWR